jgi:hypothetical protein
MKIYFADTIQRERLGENEKFKVKNNLESYFFILDKKPDLSSWWCISQMTTSTKNKAFLSAYNKGKKMACYGMSSESNPYKDKLNSKGRPTFSRAFRKFWLEGWQDGKPEGFKIFLTGDSSTRIKDNHSK